MKRPRNPGGPVYAGEYHLTPEQSAKTEAAIAQAKKEREETRVNFRWNASALDTAKKAAEMMGVPYQAYLKMAVYRQAIADLTGHLPGIARNDDVRR